MYIILRKDLDPAYQIIQSGHALFEHALSITDKPDEISHFCLLEAKDEDELLKISEKLERKDIDFTLFHEPDHEAGYTAIAAGPIDGTDRKHFKKFKFFSGS
jgi:hypothetical protein